MMAMMVRRQDIQIFPAGRCLVVATAAAIRTRHIIQDTTTITNAATDEVRGTIIKTALPAKAASAQLAVRPPSTANP